MTTRFYLPSTGTPSISPAFGTGWTDQTDSVRRTMVRTRINSAMTTFGTQGDAGTGNKLLVQFISDSALAAQTITGTIYGVALAQESHGATGAQHAVRVFLCNGSGTNVREVLAITQSTLVDTEPPEYVVTPTAFTNRRLETGSDTFTLTLTNTDADEGDFLGVEWGCRDASTSLTRYGTVRFGDDSASDLPEDETTTTADNPWVEFSMNISFSGGGGSTYKPRRLGLLGVG